MSWVRVSKKEPCPICAKADWCMVSDEADAALCMRVQSEKPFTMASGETAYIHNLTEKPTKWIPVARKKEPPKPVVDFDAIMQEGFRHTSEAVFRLFCASLGLPEEAVTTGSGVGCVWLPQYRAWGFPMRDGNYKAIGIRLRNDKGEKWAVTGSKNGIFYSLGDLQRTIVICEGPTDTAAAIACGFFAIGRPSCSAGVNEVVDFINRNRREVSRAIIIPDNDEPGLNGAEKLQAVLPVKSCIATIPCKDMREFYKMGGGSVLMESIVADKVWTIPVAGRTSPSPCHRVHA